MWMKMGVVAVIVATGFQTALQLTRVVAQEPMPAISAELAAELKALASRDYKTREKACQQLSARKLEVIEPLTKLASNGTSEESIRAFEVLRRIYREGNKEVHEAIESAMETLITSDNFNVVARAESAVEESAPIRHVRAIAAFQELGGIVRHLDETTQPVAKGEARPIKYAMINHNWKGGDEGLKHLKRIEDFRFQTEIRGPVLYVTPKCPVSKEALAEMQSHLPMLAILKRGPACLGISPRLFGGPANVLIIERVEPGSAAALADLREGDCIVKFNGYEVPDFETLVDKIGEKLPGDKVPVEFIRGNTEHTVTVELRSW